jgi:hypothetical protein
MPTRAVPRVAYSLVCALLVTTLACAGNTGRSTTSSSVASPPPTAAVSTAGSSTTAASVQTTITVPTPGPALDLVAYDAKHKAGWFTAAAKELPQITQTPDAVFEISSTPIQNRRDGHIAPTLVSSYFFLQFGDISPSMLAKQAGTLKALFIRSASVSFVDYLGGRVLDWDRLSTRIPLDVKAMIKEANSLDLPVFLELNYSDYVPGPAGTGLDSLRPADNIANTIAYLKALESQGLKLAGITFGDEIDDEAGFGKAKPTISNSDLIARYVRYAKALKTQFPALKIYAFDSYIAATRGQVSKSLDLLREVAGAEATEGMNLIDGFIFRESYVYMDDKGAVLDSQVILDDIESLAGTMTVRRYDVMGTRRNKTDVAYLPKLVEETRSIFHRTIDIGLTEYLPAGPTQIDESDTSKYADIDFVIHYADLVGTYAEQGLDYVSSWIFANDTQQAKCYLDRQGRGGLNYPAHEQLAQQFRGIILQVDRPVPYESLKVKVYAAKNGAGYFAVLLNKDVGKEHTIRLHIDGPGEAGTELALRLPARSYTSVLLMDGSATVSGVR